MQYVNLTKKKNPKFLQKYKKLLLAIGFLVFLGVVVAFFSGSSSTFSYIFSGGLGVKNTDGKVNILLLGNAGGVHDGPYLTDTVMVASLDLKKHKINLISLPRDLWLTDLKIKLNDKINFLFLNSIFIALSNEKISNLFSSFTTLFSPR